MQVGVLQFFGWRDRKIPLEDIYARALERVRIMEETGYDAIWLAEHHFSGYSVCPSVHVMGSYVAARTERLRIGTAVTLAAMHHPLRIAEEVALLDVLSGGRVNWGAGRGFDANEFRAFGVPPEESAERFHEAVQIVLAAWSQERLDWKGRYHHFEDVEVLPKPAQNPHPPTWVAASTEPAIAWAAEQGLCILMDPHSPHAEIARKRELYREGLATAGHPVEDRQLPMARLVAIAESDAKAEEIARRGAQWTVGAYLPKAGIDFFRRDRERLDPVDHYLRDVAIHGSPQRVVDTLTRLEEEMPLDYLLLSPMSEKTFHLFTDHVLPHVGGAR